MTSCPANLVDPFRCPTKWELWRQIMALLPRGRAWQTHEDLAVTAPALEGAVGTFESGQDMIGPGHEPVLLTVLQRYWAALAEVLEYLHQRACALIEEFFCATTAELRREWEIDYGFPDPCEPYLDLCEKVRALGGATCAYLVWVAARRGWAVTCSDCNDFPRSSLGCDWRLGQGRRLGCAQAACDLAAIIVTIDLDASPAYQRHPRPRPGCGWRLGNGQRLSCGVDIAQLQCLIERVRPAHTKAIYVTVGG